MAALYDSIGRTYTSRRQTDPRIAAAIEDALDGCTSILNVGAGAGSYEPQTRSVVALEPSRTMIAQRLATAAPVVQGRAEALPFTDGSFDAVLGVLTVHHWKDQMMGLAECARVARSRIVILTYDLEVSARFWLFDYLPELLRIDRLVFPPMEKFIDAFGSIESRVIPIPSDCRDGFLGAYWQRPRAYLDPLVRSSISTFAKIGNIDSQLACLAHDIDSGEWHRHHSDLQGMNQIDLGYRLLIARK